MRKGGYITQSSRNSTLGRAVTRKRSYRQRAGNQSTNNQMNIPIASGTHGQIYQSENPNQIIKAFVDHPLAHSACACNIKYAKEPLVKALDECNTLCKHTNYEYRVQQHLYHQLSKTNIPIRIPKVYDFKIGRAHV